MNREQHIKYAGAIKEQQTKAGDAVYLAAREHLKKALQASGKNVGRFQLILQKSEKYFIGSMRSEIFKQQTKARQIGKEFSNG